MRENQTHHEPPTDPRQRILKEAKILFGAQGFSATGVRQLAKRADVNVAMISYYFGSKKGVLLAILEEFFADYFDVMSSTLLTDEPLEVRLRAFLRKFVTLVRNEPGLVRLVFSDQHSDLVEILDYKAEHIRKIKTKVLDKLSEQLPEGQTLPFTPEIIFPAIMSTVLSHFIVTPVAAKVSDIAFDDDFFERYPDEIADLITMGLPGMIQSRLVARMNEEASK